MSFGKIPSIDFMSYFYYIIFLLYYIISYYKILHYIILYHVIYFIILYFPIFSSGFKAFEKVTILDIIYVQTDQLMQFVLSNDISTL